MKAKIIAFAALSALALSPVFGAPRKVNAAESKKSVPSQSASAPAEKGKTSPAQAAARELVAELTTTEKSKMLALLNEGSANELTGIKGVSKTRAEAIEKARPFGSIDEVILVSGIGRKTMSEIVSHARSLTSMEKNNPPTTTSASKKKVSPAASSPKKKSSSSASSQRKSKSVKKEKPSPSATSPKKETKTSSPSSSKKAKMAEKS